MTGAVRRLSSGVYELSLDVQTRTVAELRQQLWGALSIATPVGVADGELVPDW